MGNFILLYANITSFYVIFILLSSPASNYVQAFETNVGGTSNVTQALIPLLRNRSTRVIVNISSIMGSIELNSVRGGSPVCTVYNYYRIEEVCENYCLGIAKT